MNINLFIGICFIVIFAIFIYTRYDTFSNEPFKANANITDQSPMNFSYLTNKNYANDILGRYYLNDDTKINRHRAVFHPYMYSYGGKYGIFWWAPVLSNSIYQNTKVRL
jgi:hypothetical protein